jgi:type I restriction enzyme M protein
MLEAIEKEAVERLGYFLKPTELFHRVAEKGSRKEDNFILEDLAAILKHIESSTMGHDSEEDFEGLFEDLDLGSSKLGKTENQKNELIAKVLVHLDKIDFRLADTEADVLGDAYEYLIGQFASGAGKKAGEFYTPQEVSTILAKIVTTGRKSLKSVYDPTCGSGSLLLRVAKEVENVGHFYGQEMNPTTYNLARMNMILHGVHYQRFDLRNEDTLEHPAPEHADLRFEAIVANPPFSANWSASEVLKGDDRFSAYGKLAPSSKADFAFVQHMVHHLDHGATMACVLPHGVLFRGGAEEHIRRYLIDTCNYLDAVIGLPANIFYGTGIPTCILVLKKGRENPDDILFIDASKCYQSAANQDFLREEDIELIVSTYRKRKGISKFSHVAEMSELKANDYNLNIPRYVDTFDEEKTIDLNVVVSKLMEMDKATAKAEEVVRQYCDELGLPKPSGHNASLLEIYKKGVMQQLFSQAIRFKDDRGADFPDWQEKRLGDLFSSSRDKGVPGLPTLSVTINHGLVNRDELDRKSETNLGADEHLLVREGDIAYNMMRMWQGAFGRATTEGIVSPAYVVLRARGQVDTQFFEYAFRTPRLIYLFWAYSYGITNDRLRLYAADFKRIPFMVPCIGEQRKIANFLSALDLKIKAVAKQITQTEAFRSESP